MGVIRTTYPSPGMICQLESGILFEFFDGYRRFNKLETYGPEKHPRLLLQSSKIHCSLLVVRPHPEIGIMILQEAF